jgi:hypothetical protein
MNIEKYGFDRNDLIVATVVNVFLRNLAPETKKETLAEIVSCEGNETVVDGPALAALIENAKVVAMIGSEEWQDGEGIYQKMLSFIRESLPAVDGKKYIARMPESFLRFIQDLATE